MRLKALPDEIDFLESLCQKIKDMPESETVAARLEYLMKWYDGKAAGNKRKYNWLRFLSYFFPCCVTLVNVYTFVFCKIEAAVISATISVALTLINHIVDHYRFYENWMRYRNTIETLKRAAELYLNGCEPYNDKDPGKNRQLFAAGIESIAANELENWENLQVDSFRSYSATIGPGGAGIPSDIESGK